MAKTISVRFNDQELKELEEVKEEIKRFNKLRKNPTNSEVIKNLIWNYHEEYCYREDLVFLTSNKSDSS